MYLFWETWLWWPARRIWRPRAANPEPEFLYNAMLISNSFLNVESNLLFNTVCPEIDQNISTQWPVVFNIYSVDRVVGQLEVWKMMIALLLLFIWHVFALFLVNLTQASGLPFHWMRCLSSFSHGAWEKVRKEAKLPGRKVLHSKLKMGTFTRCMITCAKTVVSNSSRTFSTTTLLYFFQIHPSGTNTTQSTTLINISLFSRYLSHHREASF